MSEKITRKHQEMSFIYESGAGSLPANKSSWTGWTGWTGKCSGIKSSYWCLMHFTILCQYPDSNYSIWTNDRSVLSSPTRRQCGVRNPNGALFSETLMPASLSVSWLATLLTTKKLTLSRQLLHTQTNITHNHYQESQRYYFTLQASAWRFMPSKFNIR